MDKSVEWQLDSYMQDTFHMQEVDVKSYSPLALAYIGDGIFDLIIRSLVLNQGNKQVNKLHKETSSIVKASSQSDMMKAMMDHLTEEEMTIFKRGRNSRTVTAAKNQSISDYRRATGFEAHLGYLYLEKEYKRMIDLVKIGLDSLDLK